MPLAAASGASTMEAACGLQGSVTVMTLLEGWN